ncbi:hypothetical protein GGQ86_002974 [Xanthobacter flavus]|uniref:Uncharacterized protein n=1 Tax=Xanthobacter flavus TaxID=281 RepID=A0A9W6CJD3_XANFL|nr:phage tail terminator-like protein [Xanthobacter flavus]MDR6334492.1 hypothetical protein [Xanthobacter flavus]GLI23488.1 hypothetical protein XFLAVUS301_31620 [Xanthobacter flavus]
MSTQPEAIIFDLLNGHLAGLSLSPALPIAWPMVDFTPPASGMWLEAWPMMSATNKGEMAFHGRADRLGLMQVTVGAPLGAGEAPALEVAGLVAAHFAEGTRLSSGSTTVRIYTPPGIATPFKDGIYLKVPVTARWRA